ncbi:MAG: glycosyltransferase [Nostoc sp. LLA-1]|nr:glycosyltransferase [Cyanocohniella sp. LLY]
MIRKIGFEPFESTLLEGITMKVSVAMITYNHEQFIAQSLESVLMQQVNFDYEIVIGEDCSTDNTRDILIRYQKEYPEKIRLLLPDKNLGMHDNVIQVLNACRGDYIALLEGDDYWTSPYKLQKQVDFLDTHTDYTICFHNAFYLYQDGSKTEYHKVLPQKVLNLEDLLSLGNLMPTASIMFRQDCIHEFPEWIYDIDFLDRIIQIFAAQHGKIGYIDENMSMYRVHSQGNWSRKSQVQGLLEIVNWFYSLDKYLDFKYQDRIKLLLAELYRKLAIIHFEEIRDRKNAIKYTNNYLFSSILSKTSLKTVALFAIQIYTPTLFKLIKKLNRLRITLWCKFDVAFIEPLIVKLSIKHIYGLKKINYELDELIVTCLVRNGELYMKSFIEHHCSLGIKHIVFLDNGSTDETIKIAKRYDNVTILHSSCPYRKYEKAMKKYLVKRFSKNRWNLFVDIDELFDYPFSDTLSVSSLLNYLNKNSYTSVVVQMLDMFSSKSLARLKSTKNDDIKRIYNYYDISNVIRDEYPSEDVPPLEEIKMHFGGIRKTFFGSDNGLTKAALVFVNPKIELFVGHHHTKNAKIADFTCILLHYPFTSYFYHKVMEAVESDRYASSASHEYKMYWNKIIQNPELSLKRDTACRLETLNDLVEKGFLVTSQNYIQLAQANKKTE